MSVHGGANPRHARVRIGKGDPVHSGPRWIARLTDGAFAAGMIWVIVMMLLTATDVAGRYAFSRPVPGAIEMSEFMLAIFAMLGMGYTERMNANVRVTLIEKVLPGRALAGVNALVYLLAAAIVALLVFQGWRMAVEEYHYNTMTDNLGIPIYPLYALLSLSSAVLVLVLLDKVRVNATRLFTPATPDDHGR